MVSKSTGVTHSVCSKPNISLSSIWVVSSLSQQTSTNQEWKPSFFSFSPWYLIFTPNPSVPLGTSPAASQPSSSLVPGLCGFPVLVSALPLAPPASRASKSVVDFAASLPGALWILPTSRLKTEAVTAYPPVCRRPFVPARLRSARLSSLQPQRSWLFPDKESPISRDKLRPLSSARRLGWPRLSCGTFLSPYRSFCPGCALCRPWVNWLCHTGDALQSALHQSLLLDCRP